MSQDEKNNAMREGGDFIDRKFPKFCTNIKIDVVNHKNIVLSMFYGEVVIETIAIDEEQAAKLAEILNHVVKGTDLCEI